MLEGWNDVQILFLSDSLGRALRQSWCSLDFASRRHFGPAIASVAGQTRVAIALCKCKLQSQYLLPFAISICQIMMLVLLGMLSAIAFRCTSLFCVSCLTMSRHEDDHVGLHVGWTLSRAQSAPFCRGKWLWLDIFAGRDFDSQRRLVKTLCQIFWRPLSCRFWFFHTILHLGLARNWDHQQASLSLHPVALVVMAP